jgi:FtsZ-interacting cell division protein ZipA
MSTGTIAAIVVVVIVVAALIAVAAFAARRRRLQRTFGPEYDRAVESSDSRLKAEAELADRSKRVRHLDIRPLDPAAREGYAAQWTEIQQQFVDSPATAVTGAQTLITNVMRDEGYPTDDADQIMADLSVEHSATLEHFRTAQDLSNRASGGTASTEDLRQAMVHYRELVRELLGDPADGYQASTDEPVADPADDTVPDDESTAATAGRFGRRR